MCILVPAYGNNYVCMNNEQQQQKFTHTRIYQINILILQYSNYSLYVQDNILLGTYKNIKQNVFLRYINTNLIRTF